MIEIDHRPSKLQSHHRSWYDDPRAVPVSNPLPHTFPIHPHASSLHHHASPSDAKQSLQSSLWLPAGGLWRRSSASSCTDYKIFSVVDNRRDKHLRVSEVNIDTMYGIFFIISLRIKNEFLEYVIVGNNANLNSAWTKGAGVTWTWVSWDKVLIS